MLLLLFHLGLCMDAQDPIQVCKQAFDQWSSSKIPIHNDSLIDFIDTIKDTNQKCVNFIAEGYVFGIAAAGPSQGHREKALAAIKAASAGISWERNGVQRQQHQGHGKAIDEVLQKDGIPELLQESVLGMDNPQELAIEERHQKITINKDNIQWISSTHLKNADKIRSITFEKEITNDQIKDLLKLFPKTEELILYLSNHDIGAIFESFPMSINKISFSDFDQKKEKEFCDTLQGYIQQSQKNYIITINNVIYKKGEQQ